MTVRLEDLRVAGKDDSRYYTYPPTGELFASVTTITGGTSGKPWLTQWAAKLAAEYAVSNAAELAVMAAGGEQDKAVALIKQQAQLARELMADVGSFVHSIVEALILWAASPEGTGADIVLPVLPEHLAGADYDGEPVESVADWMITGFLNWVSDFGPKFLAAEMAVFNPELKVAGTLDQIVALPGRALAPKGFLVAGDGWTPCVDVKTGRNLDNTIPEQIAAYRRMPVGLLPMGEMVPLPATDGGAVLHLRPGYERGYRFMPIPRETDALAWNRFRRAAELWHGRQDAGSKPGKPAYPLREDGTVPPRRLADLDEEGYGRVPGSLAKAGVADLELLAALTEADCLELKGVGPKSIPVIRDILTAHGLCLDGVSPTGKVA